jgi:hypothetical protein
VETRGAVPGTTEAVPLVKVNWADDGAPNGDALGLSVDAPVPIGNVAESAAGLLVRFARLAGTDAEERVGGFGSRPLDTAVPTGLVAEALVMWVVEFGNKKLVADASVRDANTVLIGNPVPIGPVTETPAGPLVEVGEGNGDGSDGVDGGDIEPLGKPVPNGAVADIALAALDELENGADVAFMSGISVTLPVPTGIGTVEKLPLLEKAGVASVRLVAGTAPEADMPDTSLVGEAVVAFLDFAVGIDADAELPGTGAVPVGLTPGKVVGTV